MCQITNRIIYWKGVYYAGTKVYNALSSNIEILNHDLKVCKTGMNNYMLSHFLCSIE